MTRCVNNVFVSLHLTEYLQVDSHNGWIKDIIAYNNLTTGFSYPIIADPKREVCMEIDIRTDEISKILKVYICIIA